jgi:hypothetical protein
MVKQPSPGLALSDPPRRLEVILDEGTAMFWRRLRLIISVIAAAIEVATLVSALI